MSNAEAVEAMLEALSGGEFDGALRPVDAAFVQAARSLAAAVDANPRDAQLWRQYGLAVERLVPKDERIDAAAELLADLRAEVGD